MGRVSPSIPKSTLAAIGHLITASAPGTPAGLAMGAALQQLRVNAGATALEYADTNVDYMAMMPAIGVG